MGRAWIAAMLLLGCSGRVNLGADYGDSGFGRDASIVADAGGAACGPTTCPAGEVCCNAGCGFCAPPGVMCDPSICVRACMTSGDCSDAEYCLLTGCFAPGTCAPRAIGCPSVGPTSPVCGCDGVTYPDPCRAAAQGASLAHDGPCVGTCGAQEISGAGPCPAVLGYRWNGSACELVGGCSCDGSACGDIFADQVTCERAHAGCASCGPMIARVSGACDMVIGAIWDGRQCAIATGCSCAGPDCPAAYGDLEACRVAHAHCATSVPCSTDADCGMGSYCYFAPGTGCGAGGVAGECRTISGDAVFCDPLASPVCGCDGATYGCDLRADAAGVSIAFDGPCDVMCGAQDAAGDSTCAAVLGVRWDGTRCETISGCACVGADCMGLYPTDVACAAARAGCALPPGGTCGGFPGTACRPDEYCDFPDGATCGSADELGTCAPRPSGCDPLFYYPVCACDGRTHDNACFANAGGFDVAYEGPCL